MKNKRAAGGGGRDEVREVAGIHLWDSRPQLCVCVSRRHTLSTELAQGDRKQAEPGSCKEGPDSSSGVGQESDGKVPPHPQGLLRAGRPPFPMSQLCSSGPLSAHEVGTLVWLPRLPCLSLFWVALPWSVFVSIHQLNYNSLKGTLTSTQRHAVGRRKLCLWIE